MGRLAERVEAAGGAGHVDGDHPNAAGLQAGGGGAEGEAEGRVVAGRVTEHHQHPGAVGAEVDARRDPAERTDPGLGGVATAGGRPGVDAGDDVGGAVGELLIDAEHGGRSVGLVLVLRDREPGGGLRRLDLAEDRVRVGADVGDASAHAPGRVGHEHDVRTWRDRRCLHRLGDRHRRARVEGVGVQRRGHPRSGERRGRGDGREDGGTHGRRDQATHDRPRGGELHADIPPRRRLVPRSSTLGTPAVRST